MGSPCPTHVPDLVVLAHEEVERGAGVRADGADAAAAVSQEPQAEVGTQLRVLLEQQLWELPGDPEDTVEPFPIRAQELPDGTGEGPLCSARDVRAGSAPSLCDPGGVAWPL